MLSFHPKGDITARELCQIKKLIGSIKPGKGIRASRLWDKDTLVRHFECVMLARYPQAKASDCEICMWCPFKDEED